MLYSFRRPSWFVVAVVAVLCTGRTIAAETFVQPEVELRAEYSSNFDLDPVTNDESDTYGGVADLSALIGIATPRSETSIRPRIKLQEYADRDDIQRFEGFLDLKSEYESERSSLTVFGQYNRQDAVNAELPDAEFDDLDPIDPTTPESGRSRAGETRERFDVRPTYSYQLSERTAVGAGLLYQAVRYSSQAPLNRVDYDYLQGEGFLRWAVDPRSDLSVRVYASSYDATEGLNQTDALGGGLGMSRRWSEMAGTEIEIFYERNETVYDLVQVEESTTGWGANLSSYKKGEVDAWRFTVGRSFTPNGRGGKSVSDQVRVQYDRKLHDRLELRGAARYIADESLTQPGSSGNQTYSRLEVSLKWLMSTSWYLRGGYQYTYRDRESDFDAADDHRLMVGIGYRGLGRQAR